MKLIDIAVKIVQIAVVPIIAPIYIIKEIIEIRRTNLACAKAIDEMTEQVKTMKKEED